jgi:PAS domain S-box-containing protein
MLKMRSPVLDQTPDRETIPAAQDIAKSVLISRAGDGLSERLRDERDRFLAFAFCAADLLIELDANGAISFASGAVGDYLGLPPDRLAGELLIDRIAKPDRSMVRHCLSQAAVGRRFENIPIAFERPDGKVSPAALTGFVIAELGGRCFISVRRRPHDPAVPTTMPPPNQSPAVDHQTKRQHALLRHIIRYRAFDVAFQPIVRLHDSRINHVEALIRPRPDACDLSPGELINCAERAGIAAEVDLAMVGRVIERLVDVGEKGTPVSVAVNLSGRSFERPDFLLQLELLLRSRRSLPWVLMFEIDGSAWIGDLTAANEVIQRLRCRGYKVTLDHFGTSGAAFEQLREIEVDYVKIAGTYVRAALADNKGRAFVTAMARLCRELGIATIADEVEDESTVAFLRGCEIEYGQGYRFGEPSQEIDLLSGRLMKERRWRRTADGESLLE